MRARILAAVTGSLMSVCAVAQTATVSLTSPQNGQTVSAGTTINWSVAFTVSSGGNEGLALLVADLVQSDANPAFINIPPASGVPAAMTNFSRPAGISNPGEGGPTGYVGVQRGEAGRRNLVQIGGGQNTFGVARPAGSGIAENANVTAGVGQSGSVTLASGSFAAPSASGTYTFSLANVIANAVQQRNNPPAFSPVIEAAVVVSAESISFTVGGDPCPCDGDFDNSNDVGLGDLSALLSSFGGAPSNPCMDTDADGLVGLADLSAFLSRFGSTCN